MSDEQTIADGQRVGAFLEDPAVQAAFAEIERDIVADLLAATTDDAMRGFRAEHAAVQRFKTKLIVLRDRGTTAKAARDREERIRQQQAPSRSRK